jgi:uncharacterized membrane protein YphA (DoxX/SURF4 family)
MQALFFVGRVLFVLIFILSGAQKLMDVNATAAMIAPRVILPEAVSGFAVQLEGITGMPTPQLLAIISGVVELGGGLLIAFNIATRGMTILLILFTAAATYYFHDFWNMVGNDRDANMINALKNLTMIGGLLMLFAIGPWRPGEPDHMQEI